MAFCAYLIGVLVYPLLGNWIWGGGWLAELGREFGLGHGWPALTQRVVSGVVVGRRAASGMEFPKR